MLSKAMGDWMLATQAAGRALLAAGVPREGLLSAMLGPTADLVIEVRDAVDPPSAR